MRSTWLRLLEVIESAQKKRLRIWPASDTEFGMIDQNYGDDTVALWCRLSVFDRDVFDAIKSSLLWAAPEGWSVVVVFAVKSSAESGPQVRIDRKTMFEHVPLEHRAARYRDVLE